MEENLTQHVLASWAERSPERMDALLEIAGEYNVTSPADTIDAVCSLAVMDTGVLDAVVEYLHRLDDDTGIHDFLSRLTQSVDGRVVTANVLMERLTERISDTREQLRAYNQLINTRCYGDRRTAVSRIQSVDYRVVLCSYSWSCQDTSRRD